MPTPSPPQDRIDTVRRFNRFYTKRIGVLTQGLLESRFSLSEARVLLQIAQGDHATATDLMRTLDIDAGYMSRILGGFEDAGLIRREQAAHDRRQWDISLTAKGRKAFASLNQKSNQYVGEMLQKLTAEDQGRLLGAMRTIEGVLGSEPACVTPIVIRSRRPGDIGYITHRHGVLYARECGFDETHEALVAEILARFVKEHDPRRERLWIAEQDGEIIGSIMCAKASETVAQLRVLLVEPRARCLGVGTRLVDECIGFARSAGYEKIILLTQSLLEAARKVYERAGFRLTKEERHHSFGQDLTAQSWELGLKTESAPDCESENE